MSCEGCVASVKETLSSVDNIKLLEIQLEYPQAKINSSEPINVHELNLLLEKKGHYHISEERIEHPFPSQTHGFWKDTIKWKRASFNTLNCLIGCSIGDFGMVFFLQAFYPSTPLMWQMTLAIIAGLCTSIALETIILKTRESFSWDFAFKTAIGMSFISMVGMEIAMTSTDFMITGGKAAFDDPFYWLALIPALVAGFITPLPYNYYKLKKYDKACH